MSRRLLLTTNSPELMATLDNLLYDSSGRFNFDRLESLLEQAAKARVEAKSSPAPSPAAASLTSSSSTARYTAPGVTAVSGSAAAGQQLLVQQQERQGLLATVAAAVGGALAGPEGSELLLSSLQLFSNNGSSGSNGWQQQVSGRGSAAAAAGGPLALVLSPEGRHIRGILEDELAKGLDAAWRLNLDTTLDAASERLQGALSLAAGTPLGSSLVPQWLQQQVSRAASNDEHSSRTDLTSSGGSGSGSDGQPDLIESLLNLPRLSGEDDRVQVDGLQRLAVQLAAFSGPVGSSGGSMQQQQPLQTPQQEANTAALQQVRQAALVLRWFVSEVQLLSPEAQREALAIPMRILSKLGGRITARAVRAVLSPSSSGGTALSSTGSTARLAVAVQQQGVGSTAAGKGQVLQVAGAVPSASKGSASNGSSSSSNGVVMAPVRPGGLTGVAEPQPGNGSVVGSSVGSNGGSSSGSNDGSSSGGIGQVVYSNGVNGSSRDVRSSSSSLSKEALVAAAITTPLPSDGKGGVRGGRMIALKEP